VKSCECRALNVDDAKFCNSCGKSFAANTASPVAEFSDVATANARRRRRIPIIVASFVAIALVVAVGLTFGLRNVHIEVTSNNLVSVQLSLNVCKTSVGVSSDTPATLPTSVRVNMAKSHPFGLAVYSDNEGLIEVLAPSGWSCRAAIGADGSSSVRVAPAGQSGAGNGALGVGSTAEDVSASQTSACVGCRESLACPLFTSAASDYQTTFQKACPTTRPPSEHETTVNGNVVEFTDAPGVSGDARPSGGAYPAMGAMTYFDDFKSDGSWTETCLLPAEDKSTCKVIIGNFVARYAKR
jgi:hypothetical protein